MSAFHTQKNIIQNTRAPSTLKQKWYKIPESVPHAEKYNTKYHNVFHTGKNITQNFHKRKSTTQQYKISFFPFSVFVFLQHAYNTGKDNLLITKKFRRKKEILIQQVNITQKINTCPKCLP